MALDGPRFYDDRAVFETYQQRRSRDESPNDTLERPDLLDLIGEAAGLRVVDLGCGSAQIGRELLAAGAVSYLGVEPSDNMLMAARETLSRTSGQLMASTIEAWTAPPSSADLVISRLALHYVADIEAPFRRVFEALAPGGRLVISVEHPVITSCDRAWSGAGARQDWVVDDYQVAGRRETRWMGQAVVKYHRTVEDYFGAIQRAGLVVEALREARPRRAAFIRQETYQRRLRIPLFLLLAARKAV